MSQNGFRTRASCLAKQYSKFEVYEKKVKLGDMLHELVEKKKTFPEQKELLNIICI